jgi:hypothetical protein
MPAVTEELALRSEDREKSSVEISVSKPITVVAFIVFLEIADSIFHSLVKIKPCHPLFASEPPGPAHLIQVWNAMGTVIARDVNCLLPGIQHEPDDKSDDSPFVTGEVHDDKEPTGQMDLEVFPGHGRGRPGAARLRRELKLKAGDD